MVQVLSRHVRMEIYKYLKLPELLSKISILSRTDRGSLRDSHIINENRHWICTLWHVNKIQNRPCLLHEDRILKTIKRFNFVLSLVERINIRVDPRRKVVFGDG